MAVLQIYDRLLQFPLFQGMRRDDLEIVAGHTRFGFQKVTAGRQIIHAGDPCTHLYFLINGRWVTNVGKIRLSEPWGFKSEA